MGMAVAEMSIDYAGAEQTVSSEMIVKMSG